MIDTIVFIVAAAMVVAGALGVVLRTNPVHCALSLVLTLFGVAVLFVAQRGQLPGRRAGDRLRRRHRRAVPVRDHAARRRPRRGPRRSSRWPASASSPPSSASGSSPSRCTAVIGGSRITGQPSVGGALSSAEPDINQLARSLFSDYVFAFEITSVLLVIAVVGAVVLARRPPRDVARLDEGERPVRGRVVNVLATLPPHARPGTWCSPRSCSPSAASACWCGATRS